MVADEDFFKKVYGYSYCDSGFLSKAAGKLLAVGRKDIIEKYNQWFAKYQEQRDRELKEVSSWYVKQLDDWYEREARKWNRKKYSRNSETQRLKLLKKKKELLETLLTQKTE